MKEQSAAAPAGFPGMPGGMPGMDQMGAMMEQVMQNPQMRQMAESMMQNPQYQNMMQNMMGCKLLFLIISGPLARANRLGVIPRTSLAEDATYYEFSDGYANTRGR